MGGFQMELTGGPGSEGPPTTTNVVLTARGVRFLHHYASTLLAWPSTPDIEDRSKADALGKLLLLMQVLYFCTTCCLRLAQQLPITLLEVSTFARAICAIATLVIWWGKPLNIQEPTLIRGAHQSDAEVSGSTLR